MKIIKTLFIGIGVLLVLVVAVIGLFVATFDANQYKQELSDLALKQTGRTLVFDGDIGLSLYPRLGMKLGSMRFENAAGFGEQPMLAVKHASVSVDVMSLFAFNPQIDEFNLDGLALYLMKNKQGKTNWDDLMPSSSSDAPSTTQETPSASEPEPSSMALVGTFGGLKISNATMNWIDESTSERYTAFIDSLTSGEISPEQAFPLQMKLRLQSDDALQANLDLSTDATLSAQKIILGGFKLNTSARGQMIPVDSVALELGADIEFSLASEQLSLKGFNTRVTSKGGVLQQTTSSVSGEIGFDLNQQLLTIAVLDVQSALQDPSLPRQAISVALSAGQFDMAVEKRSLKMADMTLALNESQFKGMVTVQDYAQPAASFDLTSSRVDVDAIMGKPKKGAEPEKESSEQKPAQDVQIELPMELLRALKLDGRIAIDTLIAQGLTLKNLQLNITADKGQVNIDPLHIDLYEGTFDGNVQVNAKGEQPVYRVNKKLAGFQAGAFLKDFIDNDMVSGVTNVSLNLTTRGEWLSALKSNLNGDMSIALNDGALKGFNLRHKLNAAKAKLKGEKAPELVEQKTDFSALSLSGIIKDGVFRSQDLDLQAPLMRVGGSGSADLAKETVDYRVNAKLVATSKGQQGGNADELGGLFIPVAITGSWLSPKVDVQYDELLKASLDAKKAKISAAVEKQKAELEQKLALEKARLKETKEKQAAALKAQLEEKRKLAEAEQRAKLEEEKQRQQDEAKKKLQDKLKKLF